MPSAQLVRQWLVLRTLESCRAGKTAVELARELGASRRTIYRDLHALGEAGFPIYQEDQGRWALVEGWRSKLPPPFSPTELMSLWLYRDLLKGFRGTPFFEPLETLFQKVKATLPAQSLAYLERVQAGFSVGIKPYQDYSRISTILEQVHQAVVARRRLEIAYRPIFRDQEMLRKIDPYRVWFFQGSLYLIAFCHLRGEMRMFVLDRMKMVRLTEETFQVPEDFDLEQFLKDSFRVMRGDRLHRVRIRISPTWSRWVKEKIWHQSQEIEELEEGGIVISFTVSDLGEIKRWSLSLGREAEVLEPAELREALCRELESMREVYLGSSPGRGEVSRGT